MKTIKVLGPGCPKCKTTFHNVEEAVKQLGIEAEIIKIEDIEEMMKYNILTTPVLMIDDVIKIKGRIAQIDEIAALLKNSNSISEENNSSCCSDSNCC
jgi:small redox-active disulfide protein 2